MEEFSIEYGAIWAIVYYTVIELPHKEKENFIDIQSREMSNTFDPPPGLSPEDYSVLFYNHYIKSRNSSKEILDKNVSRIRNIENFQIGNKECLKSLEDIKNSSNFHSWENAEIVNMFINTSNSYE